LAASCAASPALRNATRAAAASACVWVIAVDICCPAACVVRPRPEVASLACCICLRKSPISARRRTTTERSDMGKPPQIVVELPNDSAGGNCQKRPGARLTVFGLVLLVIGVVLLVMNLATTHAKFVPASEPSKRRGRPAPASIIMIVGGLILAGIGFARRILAAVESANSSLPVPGG
jgi:hypothetical protein